MFYAKVCARKSFLSALEQKYEVVVITQNVDDLHERAGSTNIIHLHGELNKVRSTGNPKNILSWTKDLETGDVCDLGFQLRPHIVWFGEMVPMLEPAIDQCQQGDLFIIIGTSMQVYPAAGLISYAPKGSEIYYIDPKPHISHELSLLPTLTTLAEKATDGVVRLVDKLMNR